MGEDVDCSLYCSGKGVCVCVCVCVLGYVGIISIYVHTHIVQTLPDALRVLCEIISPDSEGGPARIPLEQFRTLFTFLAHVDGDISPQTISSVMEWLETES